MREEPWMQAQRREEAWDVWRARRPRCAECGEAIIEEKCLPLGDGDYLCPGCIRFRMVEVENLI